MLQVDSLPQELPQWDQITPDSLLAAVRSAIGTLKAVQDRVGPIEAAKATFDAVVRPLALAEAQLETTCQPLTLLRASPRILDA